MTALFPEHDFQAISSERTLKSVKVTVRNKEETIVYGLLSHKSYK